MQHYTNLVAQALLLHSQFSSLINIAAKLRTILYIYVSLSDFVVLTMLFWRTT